MAQLNRKILCFVDEYGTAGEPGFALGCVMVWARECGKADKAFSDILPASTNEVHAAKWSAPTIQGLLGRFAQTAAPTGLLMLNKRGDGAVGARPELYARALVETVKTGIGRFRKENLRGARIGNVEVVLDLNEQNSHADFQRLIGQAQRDDGLFRAVTRVTPLDSAASRMLQLADVVAHSRAWITRGEDNAAGLREKYRIEIL